MNRHDPLTEAVAQAIYDAMRGCDPEGQNHPWVPGGNSDKQDEARRRAMTALESVPAPVGPGTWVCSFCRAVQSEEREVTCQNCGRGQMVFTSGLRAGWSRLALTMSGEVGMAHAELDRLGAMPSSRYGTEVPPLAERIATLFAAHPTASSDAKAKLARLEHAAAELRRINDALDAADVGADVDDATRIRRLIQQRDEADRQAGAARRKLKDLEEDKRRREHWLYEAKIEAGYHPNVSFDEVWKAALAALRATQSGADEARDA